MKLGFLAAASLFAVPAAAFQDNDMPDRCQAMDVMMGVHKAEPARPEKIPPPTLLPKPPIDNTGPAVLTPNCRGEQTKRRKNDDQHLA